MKNKRFIELSWELLEHKFRYYCGAEHNLVPISDTLYDELEEEYKELAKELGKITSATDMVGFDETIGSCKLVKSKLLMKKTKRKRKKKLTKK